MKDRFRPLAILLLLALAVDCHKDSPFTEHRCHHGERASFMYSNPPKLQPNGVTPAHEVSRFRKRLLATTLKQIRIKVDHSAMDATIETSDFIQFKPPYEMMKQTVKYVVRYLSKLLKVNTEASFTYKHGSTDNTFNLNRCDLGVSPAKQLFKDFTTGTAIDYDLYVMLYGDGFPDSEFIASASYCTILQFDGSALSVLRPYPQLGRFEINFSFIKVNGKSYINYFPIALHEFIHILGFDFDMFTAKNMLTTKTIGSISYNMLKSPQVLAYARSYFGKDSIEGVPLENDGAEGTRYSHFEKSYFMNEVMNPTSENNLVMSNFTLKVLEDLGYIVDYEYSQFWATGKDVPGYFDDACPPIPEICLNKTTPSCTTDGNFKGFCFEVSAFAKGCAFHRAGPTECRVDAEISEVEKASPYKMQIFGPYSRCMMNNIETEGGMVFVPLCVQTKCTPFGLEFKTSNESLTLCTYKGQEFELQDYQGNFICPDPADFCKGFMKRCPNECSKNGVCLANNKCFCFAEDDAFETTNPDCCTSGDNSCNLQKEDVFRKYTEKNSELFLEMERGHIKFARVFREAVMLAGAVLALIIA